MSATTTAFTHNEDQLLLATTRFAQSQPGRGYLGVTFPDIPEPNKCVETPIPVEVLPFGEHLDVRSTATGPLGESDTAELWAWMRPRDQFDSPYSTALVMLDAMPPGLWAVNEPFPIPTVEFAVTFTEHTGEADHNDWALVTVATEYSSATWAVDVGRVWARNGRLLATARQTRRLLGHLRPSQ
jgi:hypothetical protein